MVFNSSGQLQTVTNSGYWRQTTATIFGGQDQTETKAELTRSDTKLRLKQKKICLRACSDPSTVLDIYINDKGDTREVETLKATTRC